MERWVASLTIGAGTIAGVMIYAYLRKALKKVIVYDYQQALLYKSGSYVKKLEPGAHWIWTPSDMISPVDTRRATITLSGQEIVTADNVGVKLSVLLSYRVVDAEKALNQSQGWYQDLYAFTQIACRDELSAMKVEEILQARASLGDKLLEQVKPKAAEVGIEVLLVQVKDVILPAEIRKIFGDVLRAQKEGLAALERARGEQAALRSLANAARVLENNPSLMGLRILHALAGQGGNTPPTVVLSLPPGMPPFHFPTPGPPPPWGEHGPPRHPGPPPHKPDGPPHKPLPPHKPDAPPHKPLPPHDDEGPGFEPEPGKDFPDE